MFGQNKRRLEAIQYKSEYELKPLSERALDFYWDIQILKAEQLDRTGLSTEDKLKKLSWNSWPAFGLASLVGTADLLGNFAKGSAYHNKVLYVFPLSIKGVEKAVSQ